MKIFCIGRNYAKHAKELGNALPEKPVIFMKPPTALLKDDKPFYHPDFSSDIHFETELVVRICKNGGYVAPKFAHKYYNQVTVGIDFTARDIQKELKEKGQPWELAKAFDNSAVVGKWKPLSKKDVQQLNFSLIKNGEKVQQGCTKDMIFSVNEAISYISRFFSLRQGDFVFTGTPEGVGPIKIGDVLEGYLEEEKLFHCDVK